MLRHLSLYFVVVVGLFVGNVFASDLLDRAFQPSRDLQQVINIGIGKNAVGNEVFRGSTSTDQSLGLTKACYRVIPSTGDDDCRAKKGNREKNENTCYATPALQGATEANCASMGGQWTAVAFVSLTKNAPLLVRITRTLLRLTIAISITMIIYIGVQTIVSGLSGGSVTDKLKELANVIVGLLLALSAVGIIFLIQALALNSLSGALEAL